MLAWIIREDLLLNRKGYCSPHGPQKVILPSNEKDAILKFKEFESSLCHLCGDCKFTSSHVRT